MTGRAKVKGQQEQPTALVADHGPGWAKAVVLLQTANRGKGGCLIRGQKRDCSMAWAAASLVAKWWREGGKASATMGSE